jgi:murein DD-endopeptidase MepM/ murein hydrolase activator NlpD
VKQPNQLLTAMTPDPRCGFVHECAADDLHPAVAPRMVVASVLLASLLLPVGARAQYIGSTTACTCFAFEDAKGESIEAPQLTKSILLKASGASISSPWGMRIHPILAYLAMHWGVDIAAPEGTPIFAAANGVIEEARDKGELGNYVRLRHSKTLATAYAHISHFAASVRPGVRVARGQVIAYVGSTGLSTGPHLHFEALIDGSRIQVICTCVSPALRASPQPRRRAAEQPSLMPLLRAPSNH